MKINFFFKAIPLLSTLLLIILLSISNQKEYTKLRILIWNTPTLSLGTYLSISISSGFLLSYFLTSSISNIKSSVPKHSLQYKEDNIDENNNKHRKTNSNTTYENTNEHSGTNSNTSFENTLIERDIKDPSPTVNASFRVIGRIKKVTNNNEEYFQYDKYNEYDNSNKFVDKYHEKQKKDINTSELNSIDNDWNDQTHERW